MHLYKLKALMCGLALALSPLWARATILLSDSFPYPDGALTNVAAGIWIEHSTGTPVMAVSGQAQLVGASSSEDIHAALVNQPFAAGGGVSLYAAFTVRCLALPASGGAYFAHFNSSSTFRGLVWASTQNAAAGKFRIGIGNTTAATYPSGQVAIDLFTNTAYKVVARYNVDTGSSTIWLNPANESDPGITATDAVQTVSISNFSLRQTSGGGTLLFDNLVVATDFNEALYGTNSPPPAAPPAFTAQPVSQTVVAGDLVLFSAAVSGTAPFSYQWHSNNVVVQGATNDTLALYNVTTNISGSTYFVTVANSAGATNSASATLTVLPPAFSFFTCMTYNLHGNGVTNWTTNTAQAQAIGRQLLYLKPDMVAFNEIPHGQTNEMTNWVKAFMPGYNIAVSPGTDKYIHSGIASRFPIVRSQSWLDGVSLSAFGYNGFMARDLFEAEIAVPDFPQHVHVFVAHLKATTGGGQSDADKRAAEASCISNFLVNTFLAGTNKLHPYILAGDMNEDVFRPATNTYVTGKPIQRLTSAPTSLRLTTPTNPYDTTVSNDMTLSIQDTRLSVRFDYILPCTLLFSNITGSQVFRTDKLPVMPPGLFSNDNSVASDHLPVLVTFANPFSKPFRVTSVVRTNSSFVLQWDSVPGGVYQLETSPDLSAWTAAATNLTTVDYSGRVSASISGQTRFYRVRAQ